MAFNAAGAVECPLSVFGGLVTEMSPVDLPEGVSPDCQDVVFAPGNVASRPALQKVFAAAFPAGGPSGVVPTVVYAKSFVTPTGQIENLYLDSNGNLWWEDLTNHPGTYTLLATTTTAPGTYAKSITAFGREYIAISDGLHGQEVPLQWDGTNLDRVTQDGPGAPPNVSSVALPSVNMAGSGAPPVLTIVECDPANQAPGGFFTGINLFTSSSVASIEVGTPLTISGSGAAFNGTWTVVAVYPGSPNSLIQLSAYLPPGTTFALGGSATGANATMTRTGNVVTVMTAAAHQLQVGYQAQIAGVPAATIGGGISSIVINNENLAGIATITTNNPHGLIPGIFVSLNGITAVSVGGGIASISRSGQIVTVTTNTPHGLSPGAVVTLSGVGLTSFNTTAAVLNVTSPTTFTFAQVDVDATSSGGSINLNWPIPDTATPSYFEVVAAPTATTFQVSINYSDGTWSTGSVSYAWNGTFFVSAVLSATAFQYQQYGPNATTSSVGTVTPYGQAAPGQHQCRVAFLTRQGYITRPSPPVKFTANGGQYIAVGNIPIGPSNVVARILEFTGANGAYFFYIPTPAQVNGQIVGTATQVNDNATTSVVLDFSDNTLFAAIGTSVPGNDIASQIILDGALAFGFYASRLITWGQRNRIQNLLNMGFDGGYLPSANTQPTGWTVSPTGATGSLASGHYGGGWSISVLTGGSQYGGLSQSMYQDAYGAPIATANTPYKLRCWIKPSANVGTVSFTAKISSASAGFSATATVLASSVTTAGGFVEANFSASTPAAIPSDLTLSIYAVNTGGATVTLLVDELSIIYANNPYLDTVLYGSYVDNPEAFDGVTGKFGPSQDTHKVMDLAVIRQTLYLLTQDPGGRLHDTIDNGVTEPAGWQVNQLAANCGLLSAFGLTKSQADDSSASGGEEWFAWASASGARIFGGDQPYKISQEIQPDWSAINPQANLGIWALNDPTARVIYFGLPTGTNTAPNLIYPVNYRELDTASQIALNGPIHTSLSGKLIATDHTRKWARWNLKINAAALMYRQTGKLSVVLCAGNGSQPGTPLIPGLGNVYTLNPAKLTDDDYGQINPYYVTYFFVNNEMEAALKLGGGRKMLAYLAAFISGTGTLTITVLCDSLANAWRVTGQRALSTNPTFDLEWAGGSAQAQRMAIKLASSPATGTDNGFSMGKMAVFLKVARLPVRGSAT